MGTVKSEWVNMRPDAPAKSDADGRVPDQVRSSLVGETAASLMLVAAAVAMLSVRNSHELMNQMPAMDKT